MIIRHPILLFISVAFSTSSYILAAPGVLQVAGGAAHTCFLLEDYAVYCTGNNVVGQLGLGSTASKMVPTRIKLTANKKVRSISAVGNKTCVLYEDGSLTCWGSNASGDLGRGVNVANVGTKTNETPDKLSPIDLGKNSKVKQVAVGGGHICALLEDLSVRCWGNNSLGQLGLGNNISRGKVSSDMGENLPEVKLGSLKPTQIVAGSNHTCVLLSNNKVKCWGAGTETGSGSGTNLGTDPSHMGDNLMPLDLGKNVKVTTLSAGLRHTCALLSNGSVKCWGYSYVGSLGPGLGNFTYIGDQPGEMGESLRAIPIGDNLIVKRLSCGTYFSCALLENNAVKCWGYGSFGNLGLGDTKTRGQLASEMGENLPFVELGRFYRATHIVSSGYHTCVLGHNTDTKCWGYNFSGQLGYGHTSNIGTLPGQMGDKLLPLSFTSE